MIAVKTLKLVLRFNQAFPLLCQSLTMIFLVSPQVRLLHTLLLTKAQFSLQAPAALYFATR